jgi:hypothetical protein
VTQTPKINETRVALERELCSLAIEEWGEEERSGYKRIKSFGNPDSFAVVRLFSSISNIDREKLLKILPKRSAYYLQQTDNTFFCTDEKCAEEEFVGKINRLAGPYAKGNETVTAAFDKHIALRKDSRPQAVKIKRFLFSYLKKESNEWDRYSLSKPEPNMMTFERNLSKFRIEVDWDLRPWEIFCGFNVYESRESMIRNFTFLGGLGISGSPAWYVDEETALEALKICANHALKVSHTIIPILTEGNQ